MQGSLSQTFLHKLRTFIQVCQQCDRMCYQSFSCNSMRCKVDPAVCLCLSACHDISTCHHRCERSSCALLEAFWSQNHERFWSAAGSSATAQGTWTCFQSTSFAQLMAPALASHHQTLATGALRLHADSPQGRCHCACCQCQERAVVLANLCSNARVPHEAACRLNNPPLLLTPSHQAQ